MHTSDSIHSISATKNVSHQSHLLRLRQYLMAQSAYPANPLKKSRFSKYVNRIADSRKPTGESGSCGLDGASRSTPASPAPCGAMLRVAKANPRPTRFSIGPSVRTQPRGVETNRFRAHIPGMSESQYEVFEAGDGTFAVEVHGGDGNDATLTGFASRLARQCSLARRPSACA